MYAYITSRNGLLVFRHVDFPEAGLQVPGGTVEAGESCESALWREVKEESGLSGLELDGLVGEQERDMADFGQAETQQQYFYHLRCRAPTPARWEHIERHARDGSGPLRFEFHWTSLEPLPLLVGVQGRFLAQLCGTLEI